MGGSQIQHSREELGNDSWPQSEFLENNPDLQLIRIQLGKTETLARNAFGFLTKKLSVNKPVLISAIQFVMVWAWTDRKPIKADYRIQMCQGSLVNEDTVMVLTKGCSK